MGKTSTIEENRPAVSEATIESEVPTCQHHWLIETPRGATSHGHCKRCGEKVTSLLTHMSACNGRAEPAAPPTPPTQI